jgi:hypothetical protein
LPRLTWNLVSVLVWIIMDDDDQKLKQM